jgi:Ca2+-binding RTX toxin-like protein
MPATVPFGAESDVAFISGVTNTGTVAGISFGAWNNDAPPTYGVSVNTAGPAGNESLSFKWGSSTLAIDGTSGGNVTYWFDGPSNWTTAEQNALLSGLHLWQAEANIIFNQAGSAATADIVFARGSDGQAHTNGSTLPGILGSGVDGSPFKSDGTLFAPQTVSIDTSVAGFGPIGDPSASTSFDQGAGYVYDTIVHEEGHALGLGHGGPYNNGDGLGSVQAREFSVYDSRLWTLMSYIDPNDKTAALFSSFPVTGTDWGSETIGGLTFPGEPTTPMILDILAIQRLYGAPTNGPLTGGNLTFGFNSNIQGDVGDYFNFNINKNPVVTIWAAGGNNTIDLSGFSEDSKLNLNFNSFSSAHGLVNNIAVAPDTQIKTGITGSGNDVIIGTNSDNTLIGNDGNDTLVGNFGSDGLFGGSGDDILQGGDGDGFGDGDVLDGGPGFDAADYGDSFLDGVSVDLAAPLGSQAFRGTAQGDFLISIENVFASLFSDTLIGDAGPNWLQGRDGDDILDGGAGADILDGGNGIDTLDYSNSSGAVEVDLLIGVGVGGDAQGDILANIENVVGSQFDDRLVGDDGPNQLVGGSGNDILDGRGGADVLVGGDGIDTVDYSQSPDFISARLDLGQGFGLGDSRGDTYFSIENVIGSAFDDELGGDGNANVLRGGDGNDQLIGGGGPDVLDGGNGIDFARYDFSPAGVLVNLQQGFGLGGDAEGDTLVNIEHVIGSQFDDVLVGDDNSNRLDGNDGNDELVGGAGNDFLNAGPGINILVGGAGDDMLFGGLDTDTAVFFGSRSEYSISGPITDLTIRDNIANRDGTDEAFNIEFFQFADGTVAAAALLNAAPTAVSLENVVASLAENTLIGPGIKIADIMVTDDGNGTNTLSLSGADAGSFQIDGTQLLFVGASPNFEAKASYDVTVSAADTTVAGSVPVTTSFALAITNVNEAPTAVDDSIPTQFKANTQVVVSASQLLVNDTDPDAGDQAGLQIVSVSTTPGVSHGTVAFASATDHAHIVFTPDENYTGTASFTYSLSDGHGGFSNSAATVGLTIIPDIVGTPGTPSLTGTTGADVIDAGTGNHLINAGAGNDVVISGRGVDIAFGGPGNDRFVATVNDGNDNYNGEGGNDTFDLSQISTPNIVNLGASVFGFTFNGVGTAIGSQIGIDLLTSIENVNGGSAADQIAGDNLANVLNGGAGNDTLTGLGGADTFIFKSGFGKDLVTDFAATGANHDFIALDHSMFPQYAAIQDLLASTQVAQVGNHVDITHDANNVVTLENVSLATVRAHADDFRFI